MCHAPPKPSSMQPADDFPRFHSDRTHCDRGGPHFLRQVVVVAAEATLGNAESRGKGVEFGEGFIADEMTPIATVIRPVRVVDEDGHAYSRRNLRSATNDMNGTVPHSAVMTRRPIDQRPLMPRSDVTSK